jgi:uncharacterized membrane protein
MRKFLNKIDLADLAAYGLIFIFIIIFVFLSFGRHDALKSYLNDLGTYDQALWNTVHGHFFHLTSSMVNVDNYLGAHFSPILLFFVPFYALFPSPKWFLFFQALAVGLSAVPIYWMAREKLKSQLIGLVILTAYLFYPALHNGLLYDFHELVLATFFAAWAFYFLEKRKDCWFIFFATLLALSQEHLVLLVFGMGLYLIFIKKRKKFGIIVSAASLAYFFLVMLIFIPYFSSTGKPALVYSESPYPSRYAWLGSSIPDIAKNIFLHPLIVLKILFSAARIKYMFFLVAPVFSLALFSWPVAIMLPVLATYLLSSNSMTFDIFFYHSAILAPFVYFSAIFTLRRWFLDSQFLLTLFLALVLIFSVGSSFLFSVSPLSSYYKISDYRPNTHAQKIAEIKKIIPADASLSVQHNLGPHFSQRQLLYRFPLMKDQTQYVLLDTTDPYKNNPRQLFQFEYALQVNYDDWLNNIEELKKSDKYDLIYDKNGYLLFKLK